MTSKQFDFYFEEAGRSSTQGAIAPAEQFFEGSAAETSLAREIGQNSLDARSGDNPVRLRFELADMRTEDIPGIVTLRSHLALVAEQTAGTEGNQRMRRAYEASCETEIPVLQISDYGTTGLRGSESRETSNSPLSALTRGAGVSANDGSRGGSFGIGSAVGPMSSALCTVLYTSLPLGEAEVVFAGYSRLASHRDASGTWRQAEGFFTNIDRQDDFEYLRSPQGVGPFDLRDAVGTDIYVLGYRKAADDPRLDNLRRAFLSHFLVAIYRGRLEVEGVTAEGTWRLDRDTLERHARENVESRALYRAIEDPEPVRTRSGRFGDLALYINVDETLERSLHTITLRAPLMKIDTFRHTSIPAKYAAILECADEKGNQLLRSLEPPQHDRWDPGRADGGDKALAELKAFVRDGLRSRVKAQLGDTVEIKGLSKYLPSQDLQVLGDGIGGVPGRGEGTSEEASTVQGQPKDVSGMALTRRKAVKVSVRTAAGEGGSDPTEKGKDRGGASRRTSSPSRGFPGTGEAGEGGSRIPKGVVRFRSWFDHGTGILSIALTSPVDVAGDLELEAIGAGGTPEEDYILPISSARIMDGHREVPVEWVGNVLTNISLAAGKRVHIRIGLSESHRYRLDVK